MFLNRLKTVMLLAILSSLLILIGGMLGGYTGLQFALLFAIIFNLGAYFYSEKIVLRLYQAQPLDKTQYQFIYDIVAQLTQEMKIPMPKLWVIPTPMANAFATGRNPSHASVALTSGIIDILEEHELKGVIAHELSHIKNRDILIATIAATIATAISYLASMLRFSAIFGGGNKRRNGNAFAMIFIAILMPIAAALIQLAISRSREYMADETGATYTKDPLALASALEKLHYATHAHTINPAGKESTASLFIVQPFSGRDMLSLFSTHPPVKKRIEKLQNMTIL